MADRVRSPKEARRSTLSWSKVLLLVVTGFAVYVGVKLKRSYEIYDVRVVPSRFDLWTVDPRVKGTLFRLLRTSQGWLCSVTIRDPELEEPLFRRYPVLELKGGLFPNDRLKDSELLLKGKIFGPESILVEGNTLYTGTHDGKIVEITDGKIIKEFVLGPKCNMETLENCFRPLGIRRLNAKELIVADSFQGLYTVDMKQMTYKKILEANMEIDGEPMRFADDLDILDEDTVLLSDASTRWNYNEVIKDFMEGVPSGRVLQVHIPTRKVTVVTKGLYFANGVQLFPDKKSLLVCETMGRRVHRVYLSGEKKGQREVFLENLPGIPDNVRLSDDGTFWIALAGVKHSATFDLEEFSKDHPLLRRLLLTFVPSSWLMDMHIKMKAKHTITIQVSQKGKILSSLQDTTASVIQSITQTTEADGFFYFGNFDGDYIGRLRK